MNLAALLAYLLATGLCVQTEFRASDGSRLAVMVCPRSIADPETVAAAAI
jgi:hypothetical protein